MKLYNPIRSRQIQHTITMDKPKVIAFSGFAPQQLFTEIGIGIIASKIIIYFLLKGVAFTTPSY